MSKIKKLEEIERKEREKKKRALVDFEQINEFFYNTITVAIVNSKVLTESQKDEFCNELDYALDNEDFSAVQTLIIE